jgi:phospholipid transport system substrate-binding protein
VAIHSHAPSIVVATLLLTGLAPRAVAGPSQDADPKVAEIVKAVTRAGVSLAGQSDPAASDICAKSSASLIDIDAVVKVAAEKIRDSMSPAQREAYRKAATQWIVRRCVQQNRDNKGEKPQVMGVRQGESGDRLLAMRTETPPHLVIWRLRGADKPRVVDVVMDGVSMALTLRDETASLLGHNDNDIDAMIKALGR